MIGTLLLVGGLAAYSAIPNFHTVPLQSTQTLFHGKDIHVSSNSSAQTPIAVTIQPGKKNDLHVNVTVTLDSGVPASAQLKIFTKDSFQSCMSDSQPSGCLFNRQVSNNTLTIPLNASATYYFGVDNNPSNSPKIVLLSADLLTSSTNTLVARDGSWNLAGLGLSALGLVVMLYGAASKTIIPWE